MIAARQLGFRTQDTGVPLLRAVDLEIGTGERVALVGPSGSGKTTLALHLAGLHKLALLGETTGELLLAGQDCTASGATDFAGIVLQNPENQLFADTPEAEIELSLAHRQVPCPDPAAERDRFLSLFGLDTVRHQPLTTLSLGWKQRVSVASMLAMKPRLLVLDEPTNYLDARTADELFAELRRLSEERNLTVIVIEHDLERVLGWATRVVAMAAGAVVFDGSSVDYAAYLGDRWRAWPPAPPSREPGEALVRFAGVGHGYTRETHVLADMNLTIRAGEAVALLGPNGAGKSTLLHLLKGVLKPRSGSIEPSAEAERLDRLGLVCQNPDDQIFAHSVTEECAFLPRNLGVPETESLARTETMLARVALGGRGERFPFTLSYGEKRRLTLASVLVGQPALVCLDEPTVGLDFACLRQLASQITELCAAGVAVVFATHDRCFAERVASRFVELQGGRIVADQPNPAHGGAPCPVGR